MFHRKMKVTVIFRRPRRSHSARSYSSTAGYPLMEALPVAHAISGPRFHRWQTGCGWREGTIRPEKFSGAPPLNIECIALHGQSLKHSFSSKVVNERPFPGAKMPPNYCEIPRHRSMAEKLSNECVPIRLGSRKE